MLIKKHRGQNVFLETLTIMFFPIANITEKNKSHRLGHIHRKSLVYKLCCCRYDNRDTIIFCIGGTILWFPIFIITMIYILLINLRMVSID